MNIKNVNNIFTNSSNYIDLGYFELDEDVSFGSNSNYLFSSIKIPTDYTLTINPGDNIKLSGDIEVLGSLKTLGQSGSRINIGPADDYWGGIYFSNSSGSEFSYTDFSFGNNSSFGPDRNHRGMINLDNSSLLVNNSDFLDASRPKNMIYLKQNSVLNMADSSIYWSTTTTENNICGIYSLDSQLGLDNVSFTNMDYGVYTDDSGLDIVDMPDTNFSQINILNYYPESLISESFNTTSTTSTPQ